MNLVTAMWILAASPSPVQEPVSQPPTEQQEESEPSDTADRCKDGAKTLRNSMAGLEFFLQDKKDFETYCPYEEWKQPGLDVYKKEPKSYLPKSCKSEKI